MRSAYRSMFQLSFFIRPFTCLRSIQHIYVFLLLQKCPCILLIAQCRYLSCATALVHLRARVGLCKCEGLVHNVVNTLFSRLIYSRIGNTSAIPVSRYHAGEDTQVMTISNHRWHNASTALRCLLISCRENIDKSNWGSFSCFSVI